MGQPPPPNPTSTRYEPSLDSQETMRASCVIALQTYPTSLGSFPLGKYLPTRSVCSPQEKREKRVDEHSRSYFLDYESETPQYGREETVVGITMTTSLLPHYPVKIALTSLHTSSGGKDDSFRRSSPVFLEHVQRRCIVGYVSCVG